MVLATLYFVSVDLVAGTENVAPSVVQSLAEREQGANSGTVAYRPNEVGTRGKRWISVLNGKGHYRFIIYNW